MVTAPYPWAIVRCTTDESEPTMLSPLYRGEIITDRAQKFRFATFYKDQIKSIGMIAIWATKYRDEYKDI